MRLYHAPSSPNSRRVRVYLAEKGLAIPLVPIDLAAKEQFSQTYRAINPRSVVPTLVLDDGTAIGEVPAIWRFIEESYSEPRLLGSNPKEKALIIMWERRMELEGFAAVMEAVRNSVPGLQGRALAGPHAYEQIPALAERSKQRVRDFYADLNAQLSPVSFVAGVYSAADITAAVTVDFATKALDMPIPVALGNLRRWHQKVSARPSMAA